VRRHSTAGWPSFAGASGSTAGAEVATIGTLATDGKEGISPSQGSGLKAGVTGLAPRPEGGTRSFCQLSHDSVRASTGRSGTWHPAASTVFAQERTHSVNARANAGTRP
jgi:hypothetical protein